MMRLLVIVLFALLAGAIIAQEFEDVNNLADGLPPLFKYSPSHYTMFLKSMQWILQILVLRLSTMEKLLLKEMEQVGLDGVLP